MKILQIIYSLTPGGAERFVVDLSNELVQLNNEVFLFTLLDDTNKNLGFYKSEISTKVIYKNLKLKAGFRLVNVYYLWKLIKQIKPDVVHCHLNLVNYLFPVSIIFPKIKFFHTIHSNAQREVKSSLEYYIRRFFYSFRFINAITISKETSVSFVKYYKSHSYYQIYNGRKQPTPTDKFKEVKDFIDKVRLKKELIFLHVGRCIQVKNQQMLINVFNRLNREGKSVALLIIGDGFDSSLGNELKKIASDEIYFLGLKENVSDFYLNSDAFCLTSFHEGMPITLIEAFACGCIPICTPVGGVLDSIENGITGYLSKSVNEEDFYQSVKNYLNNLGVINREDLKMKYHDLFGIEKCSKHHIEVYQNS
jgi:glycosyltransferase involved in cell wall biosynthesis